MLRLRLCERWCWSWDAVDETVLERLGGKESDRWELSSEELFDTLDACRRGLGVVAVCRPTRVGRSDWCDMIEEGARHEAVVRSEVCGTG